MIIIIVNLKRPCIKEQTLSGRISDSSTEAVYNTTRAYLKFYNLYHPALLFRIIAKKAVIVYFPGYSFA